MKRLPIESQAVELVFVGGVGNDVIVFKRAGVKAHGGILENRRF